MIVALMQPYFFPYIGYFQLMHAVDCFVFYNDAQFMKGGWINRNRILLHGKPAWWTYPVVRDDYRLPINQRTYCRSDRQVASLLDQVAGAYRDAPCFGDTFALLSGLLRGGSDNVAEFNRANAQQVAKESLGIQCEFLASSEIDCDPGLRGQDRVIAICRQLGADVYVNAIGGAGLYDHGTFEDAGIQLRFLRTGAVDYSQFGNEHVPFLSIIDMLMFNAPAHRRALLERYELERRPLKEGGPS